MDAIPYGIEGKVPEQPFAPSFNSTLILIYPDCRVKFGGQNVSAKDIKFQFCPSGTVLSPLYIPLQPGTLLPPRLINTKKYLGIPAQLRTK